MPIDFNVLAQQCASDVHPVTLRAIVRTESGFNPFAIGVVGGRLRRQPRDLGEAVATARALEARGWNYSMGLAQINRTNVVRYGLDWTSVFDPCRNLHAGAAILSECYARARRDGDAGQAALQAAISCFYSGNFVRGFEREGRASYVQRVVTNAADLSPAFAASGMVGVVAKAQPVPVVPALTPGADTAGPSPPANAIRTGQRVPVPNESRLRQSWDTFGDF